MIVQTKPYLQSTVKFEHTLLHNSKGPAAKGTPSVQAAAGNPCFTTHVLQQRRILHSARSEAEGSEGDNHSLHPDLVSLMQAVLTVQGSLTYTVHSMSFLPMQPSMPCRPAATHASLAWQNGPYVHCGN